MKYKLNTKIQKQLSFLAISMLFHTLKSTKKIQKVPFNLLPIPKHIVEPKTFKIFFLSKIKYKIIKN